MAARKSAIPITLRMMSCSWRNRSPDEAKRNPGMNAMPTPDIAPLIRATILPSLQAQEKSSTLPLPAMTIETGIANGKGNDSSGNSPRSVPVRQGLLRDRYAGTLGLARSFGRKPARAWLCIRDLCRKLAQAIPDHQGQGRDHALRGRGRENRAELLRAMRHAAVLCARAFAAHG